MTQTDRRSFLTAGATAIALVAVGRPASLPLTETVGSDGRTLPGFGAGDPTKDPAERLLFYAYSVGLGRYLDFNSKDRGEEYERIMRPIEELIDIPEQGVDDFRRAFASFTFVRYQRGLGISWDANPELAKAIRLRLSQIDKLPEAEAECCWQDLYRLAQPMLQMS